MELGRGGAAPPPFPPLGLDRASIPIPVHSHIPVALSDPAPGNRAGPFPHRGDGDPQAGQTSTPALLPDRGARGLQKARGHAPFGYPLAFPTPTPAALDRAPPPYPVPTTPYTNSPSPSPQGPTPATFAHALLQASLPANLPLSVHDRASTDAGDPAVFFSPSEIACSSGSLLFAVIAKTPLGRPPYPEIRSHISQRLKLSHSFMISALDRTHLLIRFQLHDDFLKVLLKGHLFIQNRPFLFSSWSIEFSPAEDSPLVPVRVAFPGLPANFYNDPMLRSMGGCLGSVLQIDRDTLLMTCTLAARLFVLMDISKKMPQRIWIGIGSGGFWQPIEYIDPPVFCGSCRRLGHPATACKARSPAADLNGLEPQFAAARPSVGPRSPWRASDPAGDSSRPSHPPAPAQKPQNIPIGPSSSLPATAHKVFVEMPTHSPLTEIPSQLVPGPGCTPQAIPQAPTVLTQGPSSIPSGPSPVECLVQLPVGPPDANHHPDPAPVLPSVISPVGSLNSSPTAPAHPFVPQTATLHHSQPSLVSHHQSPPSSDPPAPPSVCVLATSPLANAITPIPRTLSRLAVSLQHSHMPGPQPTPSHQAKSLAQHHHPATDPSPIAPTSLLASPMVVPLSPAFPPILPRPASAPALCSPAADGPHGISPPCSPVSPWFPAPLILPSPSTLPLAPIPLPSKSPTASPRTPLAHVHQHPSSHPNPSVPANSPPVRQESPPASQPQALPSPLVSSTSSPPVQASNSPISTTPLLPTPSSPSSTPHASPADPPPPPVRIPIADNLQALPIPLVIGLEAPLLSHDPPPPPPDSGAPWLRPGRRPRKGSSSASPASRPAPRPRRPQTRYYVPNIRHQVFLTGDACPKPAPGTFMGPPP